jgi:hypothetical protein
MFNNLWWFKNCKKSKKGRWLVVMVDSWQINLGEMCNIPNIHVKCHVHDRRNMVLQHQRKLCKIQIKNSDMR